MKFNLPKKSKRSEPVASRRQRQVDDVVTTRFTRNKTLSSYAPGENRGGVKEGKKSERQRVHRIKSRRKQGVVILTLLVAMILVTAAVICNYTSKVTVSVVSSDANIVNQPNEQIYTKEINQYLQAHPIERFRFALDLKNMNSYLASKTPEVKLIKRASFNGVGTSDFALVYRQPIIKWEVGDNVYYVDQDGVTFKNNVYSDPQIELRDSSLAGGLITDKEVKISRRLLEFSGQLVSAINDKDLTVEYLTLPPDTTRQISVKLADSNTEYVFSIDQSVSLQVDALVQASSYFKAIGQAPERVDLRVPNKAYYR